MPCVGKGYGRSLEEKVFVKTERTNWVPLSHESITGKLSQSILHNAIEKMVVIFIHLFFY